MQEIAGLNQPLFDGIQMKNLRKTIVARIACLAFVCVLLQQCVVADPLFPDMEVWKNTDFSKTSIELAEVIEGGAGKDGIPSIDQPNFVSVEQAAAWLDAREPVIVFTHHGVTRAYPLQILMYHEIVNDQLDDLEISITYCPLCNGAMVFSRRLEGQLLDFGTSGKVYANNLVMYDRQSDSWWLQFTGEAVVGRYIGEELKLLPSQIVSFEQFKSAYPEGEVLSRETGFDKKYGINPYVHYDSRDLPVAWFFRKPYDNRLPAMQRVLGVVSAEHVVAFPLSGLNSHPVLQTMIGNLNVLVISQAGMASAVDESRIHESHDVLSAAVYSREVDGRVLDFEFVDNEIIDTQTRSRWNMFGLATVGELAGTQLTKVDRGVYFSFAWLNFYPNSIIIINN